jgi:hypothetical protein
MIPMLRVLASSAFLAMSYSSLFRFRVRVPGVARVSRRRRAPVDYQR